MGARGPLAPSRRRQVASVAMAVMLAGVLLVPSTSGQPRDTSAALTALMAEAAASAPRDPSGGVADVAAPESFEAVPGPTGPAAPPARSSDGALAPSLARPADAPFAGREQQGRSLDAHAEHPAQSAADEPPPAGGGHGEAGLVAREAVLLAAMNRERLERGLEPLASDPRLVRIARERSRDMAAHSYFAHVSPGGVSAHRLLQQAGLGYGAAGENLAKTPGDEERSVALAIDALMASAAHRDNILSERYRIVGIGAAVDAEGLTVLTAIFADRLEQVE